MRGDDAARACRTFPDPERERGQASLMMLSVAGAVLVGAAVLFAFGNALGAKGRHQQAADLAAIRAAQVMRDLYPPLRAAVHRAGRPEPAPPRAGDLPRARPAPLRFAARSGTV